MIPIASDVGVIVGRFQVHRLTDAHRALLSEVVAAHPKTVVVLGLSQAPRTARNSLDFESRKAMILSEFPTVTVFYLRDYRDDHVWSEKLDDLIDAYLNPNETASLYGGRDGFQTHYSGKFPVNVWEAEYYVSGTEQRKSITKRVKESEDFRAGVIWSCANNYPRVHLTVDVAVWHRGAILLVRKPHEKGWRLPGGFVTPTDAAIEAAARRELQEETGIAVDGLRYVTSMIVDDWRYRTEEDKILTVLYQGTYTFGAVRPDDDVMEARWVAFSAIDLAQIVDEHRPLIQAIQHDAARAQATGGAHV